MAKTGERVLLLFSSVHEVLAAERRLKELVPEVDVVPVPKELSSSCGVALEVLQKGLKIAVEALAQEGLRPLSAYTKRGKKYIGTEVD